MKIFFLLFLFLCVNCELTNLTKRTVIDASINYAEDLDSAYRWEINVITTPLIGPVSGHNFILANPIDENGNRIPLNAEDETHFSYRMELFIQPDTAKVTILRQPIVAKLYTYFTLVGYTDPKPNQKLLKTYKTTSNATPRQLMNTMKTYTSTTKFKDGKAYYFGFKDCQSFSNSFFTHLKNNIP